MRFLIADLVLSMGVAMLCALNVYMGATLDSPINWAAAAFIALLALRPRP